MKIIIWMIWNESYVIQNDIDHDNIYIYIDNTILSTCYQYGRERNVD